MSKVRKFTILVTVIVALLFSAFLAVSLIGDEKEASAEVQSMFTVLEQTKGWYVVCHNQTGVMYAVTRSSVTGNFGSFTMLADQEGMPLIWKGY